MIFLVSSELSSVQRVPRTASMGSLTVPALTVVIPALGLSLGANVPVGMVCTTMKLEGILFERILVSVTEGMVWVFRVNSTGETVWFPRNGGAEKVVRDDGAGEVDGDDGAGEVVRDGGGGGEVVRDDDDGAGKVVRDDGGAGKVVRESRDDAVGEVV